MGVCAKLCRVPLIPQARYWYTRLPSWHRPDILGRLGASLPMCYTHQCPKHTQLRNSPEFCWTSLWRDWMTTGCRSTFCWSHPRTLSEAIHTAMEFESLLQCQVKRATKPKVVAHKMASSPGKKSISQTSKMVDKLVWQIDRPDKSRARLPAKEKRELEWFYCKKKGHMKGECCKRQNGEQVRASTAVLSTSLIASTS